MLFQFHVTVETFENGRQDSFISLCREENVKPVMIQLEKGDYIHQPMFTRLIEAVDLDAAMKEIQTTVSRVEEAGFVISRVKAEIDPRCNAEYLREDRYYEWHCLVRYDDETALKQFCSENNAHLSRNALTPGQKYVTIRTYDKEGFYRQVEAISKELAKSEFTVVKEKFEYSVYDSRLELDKGWV